MSAFAKAWAVYVMAAGWLAAGFWLNERWELWAAGIGLFAALLLLWPRCTQCDLPAILKRREHEPDLVPHYVDARLAPGRACARCGHDLSK
ncbi:MAG: hypothetical protein AB7O04_04970 [Hyphomonadaceae bacterium]